MEEDTVAGERSLADGLLPQPHKREGFDYPQAQQEGQRPYSLSGGLKPLTRPSVDPHTLCCLPHPHRQAKERVSEVELWVLVIEGL